jgi:hypothetical protein
MFMVFCLVAIIGVIWVLLTMSAWLSFRWSQTNPDRHRALRLTMAMLPMLGGFGLFSFHLRWTMNGFSINLSWPFVIPTVLGVVAIVRWFRPPGRRSGA